MFPIEPAAVNNGFSVLLKSRNFMLLWIGQLVSQLGDKVFFVLMIALLENYSSPAGLTVKPNDILLMAFTIPAILFGSVGGVFVDRFPKKVIMVGSDFVRGLLVLCLPFLPQKFIILLLLVFAISTITQFFAPAEHAALPLIVRKESLMAANALFSSTMMTAMIVGFAVGVPILSWANNWIAADYGRELVVATFYLASAFIMLPIKFKEPKKLLDSQASIHPWVDFKEGVRYLTKNVLILNAMLQIVTLYCVFAALISLSMRLAGEFGLRKEEFSFFLAAAGIGMVSGAGILGHWNNRLHRRPLPLIGFSIMAVVLGMFTFTHNLKLALGLCVSLGIGASFIYVPMQTLIQQRTPHSMHGKVFGFQNHAVNIALSAPLAIAGPLTDAFGLRPVLVSMSLIVAGVGLWAWKNTRRVLKDVL
ncbi:MAG: MFS transporter [Calothrix sp. MO_167.B42]|nr:MFS transporter [Calothrix sp. MO_167.B42]